MITLYPHSSRGLLDLPDASIDLVVTSPPYKKKDGYSTSLMHDIAASLKSVMKPNSLLFLNFGATKEETNRPYSARDIFSDYLNFVQTIIWVKSFNGTGRFSPSNSNQYFARMWENIFVFSKGKNWAFDKLAIGCPFKCKSNIRRRNHSQDLRDAGDLWFIPYPNKTGKNEFEKGHKDGFPPELVRKAILCSGIAPGSSVLDPFGGGATTGFVAEEMGHNSFIYEMNQDTCRYIKGRVNYFKITSKPELEFNVVD